MSQMSLYIELDRHSYITTIGVINMRLGHDHESVYLLRVTSFSGKYDVSSPVSSCSDEGMIQSEEMKRPLTNDTYDVIVRYCSGGSWHYLCSGGVGWTPTLATVACRQLGYSDQGRKSYSFSNNQLP